MSLPYWLERFTEKTPVLDQGFVRLVDVMGDDGSVVEAARVTTGKGRSTHQWGAPVEEGTFRGQDGTDHAGLRHTCTVCGGSFLATGGPEHAAELRKLSEPCIEGDRRFLRYMLRHAHWSPFHFAEMTIHLRIPMDAWRQLVRHWSLTPQEYSTRYSPAVDAIAATAPDAWRAKGGKNRQGSSGFVTEWPAKWTTGPAVGPAGEAPGDYYAADEVAVINPEGKTVGHAFSPGDFLTQREAWLHADAREVYEERLAFGVAKEQARKDLPLSNYTDVYLKGNLRNWLNMLAQRLDSHAQYEIRQYAQAIAEIVKVWCPLSWEAFTDWRLNAQVLSAQQVELVRFLVADTFETAKELAASEGRELAFDAWAKTLCDAYKVPPSEAAEFLAKFNVKEP